MYITYQEINDSSMLICEISNDLSMERNLYWLNSHTQKIDYYYLENWSRFEGNWYCTNRIINVLTPEELEELLFLYNL